MRDEIEGCACLNPASTTALKLDEIDVWRAGFNVTTRMKVSSPEGSPGSSSEQRSQWELQEQHSHNRCSLERIFYGPKSLPIVTDVPDDDEVLKAKQFIEAHEKYQAKYYEHLDHLLLLISEHISKVLKQIEKIKGLFPPTWSETEMTQGLNADDYLRNYESYRRERRDYDESYRREGGKIGPDQPLCDNLSNLSEEDYLDDDLYEAEIYSFGPHTIDGRLVLISKELSYAMVNPHPLLPGHILVCPKREVPRFFELRPEEVAEMCNVAKEVGVRFQRDHKTSSIVFAIQDGPEPGQIVPHVHVCVTLRKEGDFERDNGIYDVIGVKEEAVNFDVDFEKDARSMEELVLEYGALFSYNFGLEKTDTREVFHASDLSYATVNLRPLLPGHVLVYPKRKVHRFTDLTKEEASDLWNTAREVGLQLEDFHEASSVTYAILDGPQTGETDTHVHIHVIPGKKGPVEDDGQHQRAERVELKSWEDMARQATEYGALFK